MTSKPRTVGRDELARILGVTPQRVSQLIAEGLPVVSRGAGRRGSKFDPEAAVPWFIAKKEAAAAGDENDDELTRWRIAKLRQEVERAAGVYVSKADRDAAEAERVVAARQRLLRLPADAVALGLAPAESEAGLRTLVDRACDELAAEIGERE